MMLLKGTVCIAINIDLDVVYNKCICESSLVLSVVEGDDVTYFNVVLLLI